MYRPARRRCVECVFVGFEADAVDGETIFSGAHFDPGAVGDLTFQQQP